MLCDLRFLPPSVLDGTLLIFIFRLGVADMRCARCGEELVVGASTCPACGNPIDSQTISDDTLFFNADILQSRASNEGGRRLSVPEVTPESVVAGAPDVLDVPKMPRGKHMAVPEVEPESEPMPEPVRDFVPQPQSEPDATPAAGPAMEPEPQLRPVSTHDFGSAPGIGGNAQVPPPFEDDPFIGDGSAGGREVDVAVWRLNTLRGDAMRSVSDPVGHDRRSRRRKRARDASRKARGTEQRNTRKRTRLVIACVVAGVLGIVALAAGTYALELWGGRSVPNVKGISQSNAETLLADRGFKATVETAPSDTVEGHVIDVKPAPGTRVDNGSQITIVVGQGRHIPQVVGMQREQARAALIEAGAENIRFESRPDLSGQDVVLEVRPPADATFISSEEVVVVVSQLPSVPDVVGKSLEDAVAELDHEGLPCTFSYERSDVQHRLTVLRTSPAAGSPGNEKGVTLTVGDPLVTYARVTDYFDATTSQVRTFVGNEGFAPQVGYLTNEERLVARFAEPGGVTLAFVPNPWSHEIMSDGNPFAEVMSDSVSLEGVRLVIPMSKTGDAEPKAKLTSTSVSESTAKEAMKLCGLENMQGSCTQDNIKLPDGTPNRGHSFYCCYGTSGRIIWTVLVRAEQGSGSTTAKEVVVTAAPRTVFNAANLGLFDNRICDFVAYHDEYQE